MNKPNQSENPPERPLPNLKNPLLAGLFAWLFPGLGHFYQGRKAKARKFNFFAEFSEKSISNALNHFSPPEYRIGPSDFLKLKTR